MPERLVLPPPVPEPDPPGLPIAGALAPLLVAGLLYAVLRTPTVLLLAVLSPVLAVAQLADARLTARRRTRRAAARRAVELDELEREVTQRLAARAVAAQRRAPSSAVLAADPGRVRRGDRTCVVLGTADQPTEPVLDGRPAGERDRRMLRAAAVLPAAPVTVDPGTRIAVAGPPLLVGAFTRGIAVQTAACGAALPASAAAAPAGDDADLEVELLGPGTARVLSAHGAAGALAGLRFGPSLVSAASLARVRAALPGADVPALPELLATPTRGGGLAARFLVGAAGPLELDLVRDGPHAVVAGTTGSGKSALLAAWVLALAAAHPPSELVLLLVDCKGGAAFDRLSGLPHVAGVVTDLDPDGAERAVQSLSAELRRRERVLREAGVPDVGRSGEPRLVVVIDEFRALLDSRPALAGVLVDLAARGRSLGLHLVICTQRPAGSVRDELLANCGLRISLRVHDPADSSAVVGVPDAARLASAPPGSAVVRTADAPPVRATVARLTEDAVTALVTALVTRPGSAADRPVRRPWLEPLPALLPLGPLLPHATPGRVVLGRVDLPGEQRQPPAEWDPRREPRLVVVGRPGSGRTTLLAAVAAQLACDLVPEDAAVAWDRFHDDTAPLLVDDAEALLDLLGPHADAAVDRLLARLRSPLAAPTVLACRGPGAWVGGRLRALAGLADRTLLLGLDLDDHLALGGTRATWTEHARPGRATWDGAVAQLALPEAAAPVGAIDPAPLLEPPHGPWLLATAVPTERLEQLRGAGIAAAAPGDDPAATVLVAAPARWQAEWGLLARLLAAGAPLLADRLLPADARALTGRAAVLPPVTAPDEVVLVPAEGQPTRRRLPLSAA